MGYWATFIALDFEIEEVSKIVREAKDKLKQYHNVISWHSPNYLHLTLSFFEWLEEIQVSKIKKVLAEVEDKIPDKILLKEEIICIGADKNKYIALEVDKKDLIFLKETIDTLLIEQGLAYKAQEFIPHISLGRIKKGSILKVKNKEIFLGIKSISLYESKEKSISIINGNK